MEEHGFICTGNDISGPRVSSPVHVINARIMIPTHAHNHLLDMTQTSSVQYDHLIETLAVTLCENSRDTI